MAALNLVGYCSGEIAALIALDAKNCVFLRHLAGVDDFNAQRPRLWLWNIRRLHISNHVFEFEAQLQILQERDATLHHEVKNLLTSPRIMKILGRRRTQNALRWFQNLKVRYH